MTEEIKEGFLCPICLKDLQSPTNLSKHFEEFHQEDGAVLQQLRSVFGKQPAGKSGPNQPTKNDVVVSNGTPATGGIDVELWETQITGTILPHTNTFRDRRKETIERRVVETNQLIIRLGKLITSGIYNSDSKLSSVMKARKNVEKTCVPWQEDKEVKFCPSCEKKFTLTFRRTHCRLCGQVYCINCIDFLEPSLANSVIALTHGKGASSQMMLKETKDPEDGLKTCIRCLNLLERQNKVFQDKTANELLVKSYERMKSAMQNADLIQPKFLKMADSVNAGETEYSLQLAMETRHKLLKQYETIESLSKHIQQLGIGTNKEPGPRARKLQASIRAFASSYLADNMFTLPGLPSQDKYDAMLKEKERQRERMKQEKMLQAAKSKVSSLNRGKNNNFDSLDSGQPTVNQSRDPSGELANPNVPDNTHVDSTSGRTSVTGLHIRDRLSGKHKERQKFIGDSTDPDGEYHQGGPSTSGPRIRDRFNRAMNEFVDDVKHTTHSAIQAISISKPTETSWGPAQVQVDDDSDPILQQIQIIESYIKQARDDGRWEEVKMFEQNLQELHMVRQADR